MFHILTECSTESRYKLVAAPICLSFVVGGVRATDMSTDISAVFCLLGFIAASEMSKSASIFSLIDPERGAASHVNQWQRLSVLRNRPTILLAE